MSVAGWVVRRLLPLTVAALVALAAPSDTAAQSTAPGAPEAPAVAAGDGALAVSWAAPASPGSAATTAYDIRYILTSADETDDANWSVAEEIWTGAGSLAYTLIGRSNGAEHDVQVRAVSSAGDGAWSTTTAATPADHGNARDTATAITPGVPVVGSIADSTDGDFFSFSLSEASDIFIYTTSYLAGFLATTGELAGLHGQRGRHRRWDVPVPAPRPAALPVGLSGSRGLLRQGFGDRGGNVHAAHGAGDGEHRADGRRFAGHGWRGQRDPGHRHRGRRLLPAGGGRGDIGPCCASPARLNSTCEASSWTTPGARSPPRTTASLPAARRRISSSPCRWRQACTTCG